MCCSIVRCRGASSRIRCSRPRCCCCRSAFPRPRRSIRIPANFRPSRAISGGPEAPVRVLDRPGHADPGSAAAVERPIPRHGHQRGRRQQPLEGSRGHALARRQHLRQLGHVLLHPRRRERRVLVHCASADARTRPTSYEAIFSEGRAEFRRRDHDIETHTEIVVSPEDDIELRRVTHHQPLAYAPDHRRHELRGSRPGAAGGGRAAPGLQQPLRSDRDHRAPAGHPVHASAAIARGADRRGCST